MKKLHVTPGDSSGGSLAEALHQANRAERALRFPDELSSGPIATLDHASRGAWWAPLSDPAEMAAAFAEFWSDIESSNDRLVIWFGRHSASELAFYLAMAEQLGHRPYDIVDVTEVSGFLGIANPDQLEKVLGSERPISAEERSDARLQWRRLRAENAPFRIVTPSGLVSAAIDHFDPLILERATKKWKVSAYVIGDTMGHNSEPYVQMDDRMLLARIVALIGEGKLLAEGDPWDMRTCRVRLPD
jgi:hypothetical protein